MRSPDETTSTSNCRTSSIVPASTRETYGMAHFGRVLHRDPPHALEQALQPRLERCAAGVAFGRPGQMRERVRLDGVHQGARFAGRGDEVVPAPRGEVPALPADAGDVHRDRVDAAEVVQQPPVEPLRAQGRLHRRDVERRCR